MAVMSALRTGRTLPPPPQPERSLVHSSIKVLVDHRVRAQLQGLGQLKNPVTSSENKPMTFRLILVPQSNVPQIIKQHVMMMYGGVEICHHYI